MRKRGLLLVSLTAFALSCKSPVDPDPPPPATIPTAPANVRVESVASNNVLKWDAVSGADSYRVYFSADGSSYSDPPATTTLAEYVLALYGYYKVAACNAAGEGPASAALLHNPLTEAVKTPVFDPPACDSDTALDVGISTETAGATIYYTVDGTTPLIDPSYIYSAPIHVASGETVTITAIATASGHSNSDAAIGVFHVKGWHIVGAAGFSSSQADFLSLAIDSTGRPYVAYMDSSASYKATVQVFDGSSWTLVGSAGFSAGAAPYSSIAIGATGVPYVAFKDNSAGGKATVMRYNGGLWSNLGSPSFSLGTYIYGSLAVYSESGVDYPYVSYQDGGAGSRLTVMKYSGDPGSWTTVGVEGFSDGQILRTSLAIAPDASPIVAFMDNNTDPPNLAAVKRFDLDSWDTLPSVGEGASSAAIDYPSLAVSGSVSAYTPYLAYKDSGNADKATVKCYSAGSWTAVPSEGEGFSSGSVDWTSLAVDGSGNPWVAFCDGTAAGKTTVMKFDGVGWSIVGVAGFSVGAASYLSFAIDGSGIPYLAYQDMGAGKKATVMRYK